MPRGRKRRGGGAGSGRPRHEEGLQTLTEIHLESMAQARANGTDPINKPGDSELVKAGDQTRLLGLPLGSLQRGLWQGNQRRIGSAQPPRRHTPDEAGWTNGEPGCAQFSASRRTEWPTW